MSLENFKLLALDWDETVIPCHMSLWYAETLKADANGAVIYKYGIGPEFQLHATLFNSINTVYEAQNIVKLWIDANPLSLDKGPYIKHLIETAVSKGIKIAITTFNRFPNGIYSVLEDHIGVSQEILKEHMVIVCSGYDRKNIDKKVHLELAMKHFRLESKDDVLYVDDDKTLIQKANTEGYKSTIYAEKGQGWIEKAQIKIEASAPVQNAQPALSVEEIFALNLSTHTQWNIEHPAPIPLAHPIPFTLLLPWELCAPALVKHVAKTSADADHAQHTEEHTKVTGESSSTDVDPSLDLS